MDKKIKKLSFIIIIIAAIALSAFFYLKQLSKVDIFINRLIQQTVSEKTGIDIVVGRIGLNPFRVIELKDIICKKGDISFRAGSAALEYTIWQYILDKELRQRKELAVFFKRGCLYLGNDKKFFDNMSGNVKFTAKGLRFDNVKFDYNDCFTGHFKGWIFPCAETPFLSAKIEIKPLPCCGFLAVKGARLDLRGYLNELKFSGRFDTYFGAALDIYGNCNLKNNLLFFTSKLAYLSYIFESKGRCGFSDEMVSLDLEVNPRSSLENRGNLTISSKIFFNKKVFEISVNMLSGSLRVKGDYFKWPDLRADLSCEHLRLGNFDFSDLIHLYLSIVFKDNKFSHLNLDASTESTILNYHPFEELEFSCRFDKDIINLIYLKLGNNISASGAVSIGNKPIKIFLKSIISDFDISKLFIIAKDTNESMVTGFVSGDISLEGALQDIKTKANLNMRNGFIGNIDYETMILNLKGAGSLLEIYDSRLIRGSSYFLMEGNVDIKNFGDESLLKNVIITSDEKTIIWYGWDITKVPGEDELKLSKAFGNKIKVGFKKQIRDETAYDTTRIEDEMELEYKMEEKGSLQFKSRESDEFFGVMKKIKF